MSKLAQNFREAPVSFTLWLCWWWAMLAAVGLMSVAMVRPEQFGSLGDIGFKAMLALLAFVFVAVIVASFVRKHPAYRLPGEDRPILHRVQLSSLWRTEEANRELMRQAPIRAMLLKVWSYGSLVTFLAVTSSWSWSLIETVMPGLDANVRLSVIWAVLIGYAVLPLGNLLFQQADV